MKETGAITMKDIAQALGVSVATVSRALKDSPRISLEQRNNIKKYAREHNFTPNILAESLRHSKVKPTRVIGVIVPQLTHFYFASILSGIEAEASSRGYCILVAGSNENYDREVRICKTFNENKVCGVIVSQAKNTTRYDHFKLLQDNGIPLVFYDRICTGIDASRVVVDDYMGAYKAVTHLIETGCRRIAFYGSAMTLEISKNRFNGYKDALLKNGIIPNESFIQFCDTREQAEAMTPELLRHDVIPDAFFAINDETAIGILYTVKRFGYRVPDDISICGFTNAPISLSCEPQLTTVEQRGSVIGEEAAHILIGTVEGSIPPDQIEKRVVRTRLVIRGTTR